MHAHSKLFSGQLEICIEDVTFNREKDSCNGLQNAGIIHHFEHSVPKRKLAFKQTALHDKITLN